LTNFSLVDHKQLHNVVIDRLRDMIIQGDLHAGEWLRQERLARELGVSHTPIREALKQLEVEGLVEHVPYRGVRVVEFSIDDVEDIYTMRSALEGLASAAAATHLTDEELIEIRRIHETMVAIAIPTTPDSLHALRELNRQFHRLIIQGSHRSHLTRTLDQIWSWSPTMLWSQFALETDASTPDRVDTDNRDHEMIVKALEAHDAEAAERLMRTHIDQTRQALIRHLNASMKVC
jgi:DNA-binding GntR family transcriptional regulator